MILPITAVVATLADCVHRGNSRSKTAFRKLLFQFIAMFDVCPVLVHWQFRSSPLNLRKLNRAEAPLIHANVHAVSRTRPLIMNVPE